jgi:CRISPR-associated protein Csx16
MTRWFISRHSGAVEWATRQKLSVDRFAPHLNVNDVQNGDYVYGILPVELAAEVCRRGARFFSLCMTVPEGQRGHDLTVDDLFRLHARLREFHIVALENDNVA